VSARVVIAANVYGFANGGGHLWAYLNWALGLRSAGCDVVWLERVPAGSSPEDVRRNAAELGQRLAPYGLDGALALVAADGSPLTDESSNGYLGVEAVREADILLSFVYLPAGQLPARRSALVDIDPGRLQIWVSRGWLDIGGYDVYFTTGETVGRPHARFPDAGFEWDHTAPCVALEWWKTEPAPHDAAFTTVSNWETFDEWMDEDGRWYSNDKRDGFLPFLDLPSRTEQPLELALCLSDDQEEERESLQRRGWRVRDALAVAATPWDYQAYIAGSLGEFSCVKPSCRRLENAWVSDRTVCYLASGKPAVIEDTGPSALLRDGEGVFRFRDIHEAERALAAVAEDYDRQSKLARALAEELFDAKTIATCALERALE
jgi:hypothetical protein